MVTEFDIFVDQWFSKRDADGEHADHRRREVVGRFFLAHHARLAQGGSIVATWRGRDAARSGPYYRLTCRDTSGRQRSVYLGGEGPLIEQVQQALAELQKPDRLRRQIQRLEQALRAEITATRRGMDGQLQELGLYRRGTEIRGWRRLAQQQRQEQQRQEQQYAARPRPSVPTD